MRHENIPLNCSWMLQLLSNVENSCAEELRNKIIQALLLMPCHVKVGEDFSQLLVFDLSINAPGMPRCLCLTSLSVSCYRDPSPNSPAGSEGDSTDLSREMHQQHKGDPSVGLPTLFHPLPATASASEGLILTVY